VEAAGDVGTVVTSAADVVVVDSGAVVTGVLVTGVVVLLLQETKSKHNPSNTPRSPYVSFMLNLLIFYATNY